jgi:hypothetical protein
LGAILFRLGLLDVSFEDLLGGQVGGLVQGHSVLFAEALYHLFVARYQLLVLDVGAALAYFVKVFSSLEALFHLVIDVVQLLLGP